MRNGPATSPLEHVRDALKDQYRVDSVLGSGGMATVYLALDRESGSMVAIKVLHQVLTAALGHERFLREIEIASRLDHPHIVRVIRSGETDGVVYCVMPYVKGDSLRELLARQKQLSVPEAVRLGSQIADALAYAHAQGFVHRDIKPGNILLREGNAAVTDFGIARAIDRASDADSLTTSGLAIGTPAYMAPEQATRDREIDGRADIYGLGCLLYETLVGEPPFTGTSIWNLAARHATQAPIPIRTLRAAVSPAVESVVMRALEKTPADRYKTAAEFRTALIEAAAATAPPPGLSRRSKVALGAAVLAAIAVPTALALRGRSDPAPNVEFTIPPPTGTQFSEDLRDVSAVSPNGRDIVFAGVDSAGNRSLWIRPLSSTVATRIEGSASGQKAFWSPDGKRLGFFTSRALAWIDLEGGVAHTLDSTFTDQRGGSWADNGTVLYAPGSQTGVFLYSLSDSTTRRLTRPDTMRGEIGHLWPFALPGGRQFLYFVASDVDSVRGIYLGSVESAQGRRIVPSPASGIYSRGHLLFLKGDSLVAQRLDLASASLVGEARVISDSILTSFGYYGAFSASESGVLVFARARSRDLPRLAWLDSTGAVRGYASEPGYFRNPDLSNDGRWLAFEAYRRTNGTIRHIDLTGGVSNVLSDGGTQSTFPVWSPDASSLAFVAERPGGWGIYVKSVTHRDSATMVLSVAHHAVLHDWAADGRLLLAERNDAGDWDLVMRQLSSPSNATLVAGGPGHQLGGRVSRNGRYLAFVSYESGTPQIYVQRFPVSGGRCQVSSAGGVQPVWGRNPDELFFLSPDGTLMRAQLDLGRPLPCPAAPARPLFRTPVSAPATARSHFDVSAADGRFLFRLPGSEGNAWLNVAVNWLAAKPR